MITIFWTDFGYQVLKAFFNVYIIVEAWIKTALYSIIIVVLSLKLCKLTLNKILFKQLGYEVDYKWLIIVIIIMQEHKVWSALKRKPWFAIQIDWLRVIKRQMSRRYKLLFFF